MQTELSFALDIVAQACALTRSIQGETITQVFNKEDRSPVTLADYSAQLLITHGLQETFTDIGLMAEEKITELYKYDPVVLNKISSYVNKFLPGWELDDLAARQEELQAKPLTNRFWVLDPIDGTKGFLRRDQYVVALALMEDGQPILGVIGCPNLNLQGQPDLIHGGVLAYATRGGGAWLQTMDRRGRPVKLSVSNCADPSQARFVTSVESGHSDNSELLALKSHLANSISDHHFDSQAKYVMVASGKYEVFFRLPPRNKPVYHEKVWDHAAGALLVQEAGGMVTDVSGKPLDFTKGSALTGNYGTVVTNGLLHSPIVDYFKKSPLLNQ